MTTALSFNISFKLKRFLYAKAYGINYMPPYFGMVDCIQCHWIIYTNKHCSLYKFNLYIYITLQLFRNFVFVAKYLKIEIGSVRYPTGYFCVQDSLLFFGLNSIKRGGGYSIVTISEISLFEK